MLSGSSVLKRRRGRNGFTLIELMIVMAIIVILISVAIPFYMKSINRAKESVLHNNLSAMRNAIDEYSYDKQKRPAANGAAIWFQRRLSERCAEGSDYRARTIRGRSLWKIRQFIGRFHGAGHFRYQE